MTSPTTYGIVSDTFVPMLTTLSGLLDKASEHARVKNVTPTSLAGARLAPDMFSLAQQVWMACHYAKDTTARLTGAVAQPPHFEDKEATLAELKASIASTIAEVGKVGDAAFEGAADRDIVMPLQDNLSLQMKGAAFVMRWSLPQFYFHVVTAYDILRHSGVELGKREYMSSIGSFVRRS